MNFHPTFQFPQEFTMPPGSIVPFAGKIVTDFSKEAEEFETNVDASGWLVCDGREVEKGKYPRLYAALGDLYSKEGDLVSEFFRLPDYQGQFLRMVDPSETIDPGERKLTNGVANTGVGSMEEDAFQEHKHNYDKSLIGSGSVIGVDKPTSALTYVETASSIAIDSSSDNNVRTTTETRPKNFAVYYLIKAV